MESFREGNMLANFARIARAFTIFGVLGLLPSFATAQTIDPLVGAWNIDVTVTGGCTSNCKYIGVVVFNEGNTVVEQRGTAVEYYGLGYVDRTALGKWWRSTTGYPYEFKAKNFVFGSTTGELAATIIGTSGITLSSNLESFSGSGTAKIYNTSGTLIETETFTISGTRF
jgi:hypothetical protein